MMTLTTMTTVIIMTMMTITTMISMASMITIPLRPWWPWWPRPWKPWRPSWPWWPSWPWCALPWWSLWKANHKWLTQSVRNVGIELLWQLKLKVIKNITNVFILYKKNTKKTKIFCDNYLAVAPPADKKERKYQQNLNSRNWPANFQEKLGCHACDGRSGGRPERGK